MDIETFTLKLYTCGCGYKTTDAGNSSKHKKVPCGHEIVSESREFVLKTDYTNAISKGCQQLTISLTKHQYVLCDLIIVHSY